MKSNITILLTSFLGGIYVSLFIAFKPPPYIGVGIFVAAGLYYFWTGGEKIILPKTLWLGSIVSYFMGTFIMIKMLCVLINNAITGSLLKLTLDYCPDGTGYVSVFSILFFLLGLYLMRYEIKRNADGLNKKSWVVYSILLIVFSILALGPDLMRLFLD